VSEPFSVSHALQPTRPATIGMDSLLLEAVVRDAAELPRLRTLLVAHHGADPQGIHFGGNEMRISPRDLVKFGELYRNGGRHNGVQVVPEAWSASH
jgi:hypothetical protein